MEQEINKTTPRNATSRADNITIQNKNVRSKNDFMEKLNPIRTQFPCNKFVQKNEKQNIYAFVAIF